MALKYLLYRLAQTYWGSEEKANQLIEISNLPLKHVILYFGTTGYICSMEQTFRRIPPQHKILKPGPIAYRMK